MKTDHNGVIIGMATPLYVSCDALFGYKRREQEEKRNMRKKNTKRKTETTKIFWARSMSIRHRKCYQQKKKKERKKTLTSIENKRSFLLIVYRFSTGSFSSNCFFCSSLSTETVFCVSFVADTTFNDAKLYFL